MQESLKIEYVDIDSIKPYENNTRLHSNEQIEQIKSSIEEFGNNDPIGVWHDEIVEGHGRYQALKELGYKEIPIIRLDNLTDEQRKAYGIVHNKLTDNSEFDFSKLDEEVEKLKNLDLSQYGIEIEGGELSNLEIVEDEVPKVPEEPKSKLGDIYQLGNHRLMCGDSTNEEDVSKLMNGVKADMLFTDPPYNVNITEKKKKKILHCNEYNELANDDMSQEDFMQFLNKVFHNANEILKDNASYYVFTCQGGDNEMMMMMMRENGIKCRHQIIWVKDAPVFSMGRLDYDYKHEPILYGWKKSHIFYRKGEQDKSVWEFKRTANKLHPTMKPIELVGNALNNSSKQDDLIIDLFGGSGSTLIACEQLNRRCYMMELDPHYVDVIIQRWENFTGKKAVKLNG